MREAIMKLFNINNENERVYLSTDREYAYSHFNINNGQATVGGARIGDILYYSISFCSPIDNFSKKKGRQLVIEALIQANSSKRGVLNISNNKDMTPAQLFKIALENHISKMRRKPAWLKSPVISFRSEKIISKD